MQYCCFAGCAVFNCGLSKLHGARCRDHRSEHRVTGAACLFAQRSRPPRAISSPPQRRRPREWNSGSTGDSGGASLSGTLTPSTWLLGASSQAAAAVVLLVVVMGLPPELACRVPAWLRERASGGRIVQFAAPVRACFVFCAWRGSISSGGPGWLISRCRCIIASAIFLLRVVRSRVCPPLQRSRCAHSTIFSAQRRTQWTRYCGQSAA